MTAFARDREYVRELVTRHKSNPAVEAGLRGGRRQIIRCRLTSSALTSPIRNLGDDAALLHHVAALTTSRIVSRFCSPHQDGGPVRSDRLQRRTDHLPMDGWMPSEGSSSQHQRRIAISGAPIAIAAARHRHRPRELLRRSFKRGSTRRPGRAAFLPVDRDQLATARFSATVIRGKTRALRE